MSGSVSGGKLAAQVNLAKDPDFYKKIGKRGGTNGTGHKFAHGKISPRMAGKLGGRPAGYTPGRDQVIKAHIGRTKARVARGTLGEAQGAIIIKRLQDELASA